MTQILSVLGSILFCIANLFPFLFTNMPKTPSGQQIDLSRFELTFSDEFEGDTLDSSKWITPNWITMRKGGFWHRDTVSVKDGNLYIAAKYLSADKVSAYGKDYKEGYYTGVIETRGKFEQCYGYYEIRCILPPATGMWSAFWMMNDGVYNVDNSGDDGTEVDIFESMRYKDHWWKAGDSVTSGIYYDGYEENSKNDSIGYYYANNPYEEYNTYGLEWTPEEYIFYINGVETGRITTGGVSDNPEYIIVSCEIAGNNGVADADRHGTGKISIPTDGSETNFIVDYVRVYQHK